MKKTIENSQVCDAVNKIIDELMKLGFEVLESKLEDYHFHQMYFKVNANIDVINNLDVSGLTLKDNFLICDCHWSRIEFIKN